jgi:uncharacterized protein (TIGR00661 family)
VATIFYSMCGHGRGHASRAQAVVEALGSHHQFFLFCPGDAYETLAPVYRGSTVTVLALPLCMRLEYHRNRVSLLRTCWQGLLSVRHLRSNVRWIEGKIAEYRPDLAISDLEPVLPRAAARTGLPCVALDNQHFMVTERLDGLPFALRVEAFLTGLYVRGVYRRLIAIILPTFGGSETRRSYRERTHRVGPLLRSSVLEASSTDGGFVLAYLRDTLPAGVLAALEQCPLPVRVYGLGRHSNRGSIAFSAGDPEEFFSDLASCRALISTAGHQTLCEALYLQKPIFLLPETGHFEQLMNAHRACQTGGADWCDPHAFSLARLTRFLGRLGEMKADVPRPGNQVIRALLEKHLQRPFHDGVTYADRERAIA